MRIIRIVLMIGLLIGIYIETGICTTIFAALTFFYTEFK